MHSLGAVPAVTTTAAVDWSIRYQQPHDCMVLKASLANERCEFKLRICVGIRTAKSDGDGSVSRHGSRNA
jgi:hypothetical protein